MSPYGNHGGKMGLVLHSGACAPSLCAFIQGVPVRGLSVSCRLSGVDEK